MCSDTWLHGSRGKLALIFGVIVLAIIGVTFMHPIPQDPAYHHFIDQRMLFGVPNFWNVASNILFVIVGLFGLLLLAGRTPVTGGLPELRPAYRVFFIGVLLTGFGSGYYHLDPGNETLAWDRLPMTFAFMAFFSMIIGEHLSSGFARLLLWPLLVVGILSIAYWHITESEGRGDLRPYALVQFLPMVVIPMILLMFRSRLTGNRFVWAMIGLYAVSKITEYFDAEIFTVLGAISGHSIKHIVAAIGTLFIWLALRRRRPVTPGS